MFDDFTLATLNLYNFAAPPLAYHQFDNIYSQQQWRQKCDWISRWVRAAKPQLLAMQEVFSPEALQTLCDQCGLPYFVTIAQPQIEGFVAHQSVVALASSYPLTDVSEVEIDRQLIAAMGLTDDFAPSRSFLRATAVLPGIGSTDIYVVHFKSPRSLLTAEDSHLEGVPALLAGSALGRWASIVKRGTEAALLYQAMLQRRSRSGHAMVLMGDFNATIDSSEMRALMTDSSRLFAADLRAAGLAALDELQLQQRIGRYRLYDAWALWQQQQQLTDTRPVSHFHGASGSAVDHILLSQEFNGASQHSLGQVQAYRVYDDHLLRPNYQLDVMASDHTPVTATISLRHP
ncbi:endonuclease/exonuclease/phosphatase family protein [Shewanella dokdonensis]|uniref:Endonuclease/exonuclease/phosphatase family protein n=1 Tax=Shewanella dokdonensis TaxID=712036 RepID=A0ABX8DEX2_9GAMM|nr:endonuclease/exonuclease/phosphatase family protein [Shewanella dokdonensis]MCL1074670.1 endonuclease/exonuclease/phosphatase family protein [Shewanella dokdonensis]QVK22342.1 endonuclease/exonuclease/phosphatase family protein [Shewanella dokdonensis]